jgi:hypothetical protein
VQIQALEVEVGLAWALDETVAHGAAVLGEDAFVMEAARYEYLSKDLD